MKKKRRQRKNDVFPGHPFFYNNEKEKEVIQPQVPLRLPCDDLTLLAKLRFDFIENKASSRPYSGGLTGGECKEQGHIHRTLITFDY